MRGLLGSIPLGVIAAIAFVIGGAFVVASFTSEPKATTTTALVAQLGRGIDDVVLVDDSGGSLRWRELNGRPRAVFFGFTRCPVICPVTVWEIEAALEKVGPGADRVQVDFISLDPARDTPGVLKSYFSSFKGRVRSLTGAQPSIDRVAAAFEVSYDKVELANADYTLDHTAAVFLLSVQGQVVDSIAYGTPQDVMIARLKRLIAGAPAD